MKQLYKTLFLYLTIYLISCSAFAQTLIDPSVHYKTIHSPHFETLYNAEQEELAKEYVKQAERAYELLAPLFKEAPEKTILWIHDYYDATNGSATPIPRPTVTAYPALPNQFDSIGNYDNWAQGLVVHEYTHILNMEPTHGWLKPFRFLLGGIVRPNALLPRWYLEGLAVQMESTFNHFGRLNSSNTSAMIRSMVEDRTWGELDIAQINDLSNPEWPRGSRPYFLGALLWDHMIQKQPESSPLEIAQTLNQRYSARFPFFITAPAVEEIGFSYQSLLSEMYDKHLKLAKESLQQIKSAKVVSTQSLKIPESISQIFSRISPDQTKMLVISQSFHHDTEIYLYERKDLSASFYNLTPTLLTSGTLINRVEWMPDSKNFVFSKSDNETYSYNLSDLYLYHLENKKADRLTKQGRAFDAVASFDGNQVVYVKNHNGSTELWHLTLPPTSSVAAASTSPATAANSATSSSQGPADYKRMLLYQPPLQTRISNPIFINNEEVLFQTRNLKGQEQLAKINLQTKAVTPIFNELKFNLSFARATTSGFLFCSDSSGTQNIYLSDKNFTHLTPLTNTISEALAPEHDLQTGELYYSELTSQGYRLHAEKLQPRPAPPQINYYKTRQVHFEEPKEYTVASDNTAEITDYQAWKYLFPQYWFPFVSSTNQGTFSQASFSGSDPLRKHSYAAELNYSTLSNRSGKALLYSNHQTPVELNLLGVESYTYLYSDAITSHDQVYSLTGVFFPPYLSTSWLGQVGWRYESTDYDSGIFYIRSGPSAGIMYDNEAKKGYQISPENQGSFSLVHTQFLPMKDQIDYGRTNLLARYFLQSGLPKHHVLLGKTEISYSDKKSRSLKNGVVYGGGEFSGSVLAQNLVVRGYPVSEFVGWTTATASLEYRFPLEYTYHGFGATPFFIQKTYLGFFFDTLTTEGAYYDKGLNLRHTNLYTFYSSYGLEFMMDTTIFYHMPLTFRFGLHNGLNSDAMGALYPFIGIGT